MNDYVCVISLMYKLYIYRRQLPLSGRGAYSGEKRCLGGDSTDPSLATANDVIILIDH
jgi:hypothetical protein